MEKIYQQIDGDIDISVYIINNGRLFNFSKKSPYHILGHTLSLKQLIITFGHYFPDEKIVEWKLRYGG